MTAASVLISVFEFLERANQTNHQKVDMFTSQRTFVKKKKKKMTADLHSYLAEVVLDTLLCLFQLHKLLSP